MNTLIITAILLSGINDCKNLDYETGLVKLNYVQHEIKSENINELMFYKMVAEYSLKNKECINSADNLLESFSAVPTRYSHLAYLIRHEASQWRDELSLDNISDKMKISKRNLEIARTGKHVQDIQNEIIQDLDKLIKEEEDRRKSAKDKKNEEEREDGGDANSSSPAPDSKIIQDIIGKGKIDDKNLGKIMEHWGKLPEKERAKILIGLSNDFPAKYKSQIESYNQHLNRQK